MHAPKFLRRDSGTDFPHPPLRVPLTTRLSYVFWWFVVPLVAAMLDLLLLPAEWLARALRRQPDREWLQVRRFALAFGLLLLLTVIAHMMLRREDFADFVADADPDLNDRDAIIEVLDRVLPESGFFGGAVSAEVAPPDDPDLLMPEP